MTRWLLPSALTGLVAVAAIAIVAIWTALPSGRPPIARHDGPPPRTAVIVDQLSLTSPNESFVASVTATLRDAGYSVDYVPGEDVTVDYYRSLPSRGYGLILVRAHSGFVLRGPNDTEPQDPFLFTSEPFTSHAHDRDQSTNRLSVAYYLTTELANASVDDLLERYKNEPRYFGIKPGFVESSMAGTFPGSTVVLMGCSGLATEGLAEAFVRRGARTVVGWDDLVSAPHTDGATERLLQRIVAGQEPARAAVTAVSAEAGADPTYGGRLTIYED